MAENNWYIKVSGTAGNIEKAFHVQLDNFSYDGQTFRSNTGDPSINDASGAHVAAITGMDDFGFQPDLARQTTPDGETVPPVSIKQSSIGPNGLLFEGQCFTHTETHTFSNSTASVTYSGNRYGANLNGQTVGHFAPCGYQPSELQTAYSMNSLYKSGLDGTGQTVVITDAFGSSTIAQDAEAFSQIYGLPDLTSSNFTIITPPGRLNFVQNPHWVNDWQGEITLDVELVHAMAPGAHIVLVTSPNNGADLDEAVNYAVVHHLGNVISNSWSSTEGVGNPAQFNRDNRILEAAAAQGIDVNFSSGDCGDFSGNPANPQCAGFKTVGFPGSSPFATSIGGTSLALNPDNTIHDQTGWGNNFERLTTISPTWNPADSAQNPIIPPLYRGFVFGAGGGESLTFSRPSWQTGAGLPSNGMRMVPDVAMLADPYTGAEIVNIDQANPGFVTIGVIGGTSLACPMFSAIMAVAIQAHGGVPFGQAAPLMYGLSSAHDTSAAIFDVDAGTIDTSSNVVSDVTTTSGTTHNTYTQILRSLNGTPYVTALYENPAANAWYDLSFGNDSSLTTGPAWDDVTGVGTPNGANFVSALAALP